MADNKRRWAQLVGSFLVEGSAAHTIRPELTGLTLVEEAAVEAVR